VGALCDSLKDAATRTWRWFFPERIEPAECVLELLRFVYPTVDWESVSFYDGWPHFIGFSPNVAITLPDTYTPHRINIYFKPGRWDPCTCDGLGLIVHEGFHALQIRDTLGGLGPGFARPFIVQYLACWAANGFKYDDHPMEEAAYVVAGRANSLYEACCSSTRRACDCSTDPPSVDVAGLAAFQAACAHVVQQDSGLNFLRDLAHCTPGLMALHRLAQRLFTWGCHSDIEGSIRVPTGPGSGPTQPDGPPPPTTFEPGTSETRGPSIPLRFITCLLGLIGAGLLYIIFGLYYVVWLLVWSLITVILWLVKIIVEIVGAIISGLLWVIAGIACALEWIWDRLKDLWNWFKGILGKVCNWAERLERRCTEWEEERTKQCTKTKEEREQKCTQTKEERTKRCAETREERTKNCCTWWPCSWGCKAFVWVTNVVCVAWTWVTNVVCIAWTWITHVVCVAWTWVVTRVCKGFTWVVTRVTCW
jgi:hypothetical protein